MSVAQLLEGMTLPKLAAVLAVALTVNQLLKHPAEQLVSVEQCQTKYCSEILVDTPTNTLTSDESNGAGLSLSVPQNLRSVYLSQKETFVKQQMQSPGVRLIATSDAPEALLATEELVDKYA